MCSSAHDSAATMRMASVAAGSLIGGYRLLSHLGAGGMGTVWEAVDADGLHVAMKILHPQIAADPLARRRLEREAAVLSRIHDPRVARILDIETGDAHVGDLTFVVTELVHGPTLQDEIEHEGAYRFPDEAPDFADLAHGLVDALDVIHRAGVVHRDLKPSNVMLGESGPVLIDFGIAQVADDVRLTQTGQVTGTPGFLPPEMLDGQAPGLHVDWYACAAVLLFALTGSAPFGAGPWQGVFRRVYAGTPELGVLPQCCPPLARVFTAALAPNPAERLDIRRLLEVIDDVVAGGEGLRWADTEAEVRDEAAVPGTGNRGGACVHEANTSVIEPYGDDGEPALPPSYQPARSGEEVTATAVIADSAPTMVVGEGGEQRHDDPWVDAWGSGGAPACVQTLVAPQGYGINVSAEVATPSSESSSGWGRASEATMPDSASAAGSPTALPEWARAPRYHSGVVVLIGFVLTLLGAWMPLWVCAVAVAIVVLMGTIGRAHEARRWRRLQRGVPAAGDTARMWLVGPFYLLRSLIANVMAVAIAVGVLAGLGYVMGWFPGYPGVMGDAWSTTIGAHHDTVKNVLETGVVLLVTWWVPWGTPARRGAGACIDACTSSKGRALITLVLLLFAALTVGVLVDSPVTAMEGSSIVERMSSLLPSR